MQFLWPGIFICNRWPLKLNQHECWKKMSVFLICWCVKVQYLLSWLCVSAHINIPIAIHSMARYIKSIALQITVWHPDSLNHGNYQFWVPFPTLSEGLVHSTVHHHLRQLYVYLQSGALIFITELQGVILLFTNKDFK